MSKMAPTVSMSVYDYGRIIGLLEAAKTSMEYENTNLISQVIKALDEALEPTD